MFGLYEKRKKQDDKYDESMQCTMNECSCSSYRLRLHLYKKCNWSLMSNITFAIPCQLNYNHPVRTKLSYIQECLSDYNLLGLKSKFDFSFVCYTVSSYHRHNPFKRVQFKLTSFSKLKLFNFSRILMVRAFLFPIPFYSPISSSVLLTASWIEYEYIYFD